MVIEIQGEAIIFSQKSNVWTTCRAFIIGPPTTYEIFPNKDEILNKYIRHRVGEEYKEKEKRIWAKVPESKCE